MRVMKINFNYLVRQVGQGRMESFLEKCALKKKKRKMCLRGVCVVCVCMRYRENERVSN